MAVIRLVALEFGIYAYLLEKGPICDGSEPCFMIAAKGPFKNILALLPSHVLYIGRRGLTHNGQYDLSTSESSCFLGAVTPSFGR
jgi:hypothetical protein